MSKSLSQLAEEASIQINAAMGMDGYTRKLPIKTLRAIIERVFDGSDLYRTLPCGNCGHSLIHNEPCGTIADCCPHPDCNCGYYTPLVNQESFTRGYEQAREDAARVCKNKADSLRLGAEDGIAPAYAEDIELCETLSIRIAALVPTTAKERQ